LATTCFLSDETHSSIEEGIIMPLLDLIPENGAIVQVDPGPSLVAEAKDENSLLLNYNIKLDIGRVHNKQKILSRPSILDKSPLVTTSESSLDSENSFDSTRSLSSSVFM
jgi:hypothetical protein